MEQRTTDICPRCTKVRYRRWSDAAAAARRMRRQRHLRVEPYHSRRCDCYHVGSKHFTTSGRTT